MRNFWRGAAAFQIGAFTTEGLWRTFGWRMPVTSALEGIAFFGAVAFGMLVWWVLLGPNPTLSR
jgi:hypothetical protein